MEIGDDVRTDVLVDQKLDNILQDGLKTPAPTTLWLINRGRVIMAVQVADGPRYYGKVNPFFYAATLVFIGVTLWSFSVHWGFGLAMTLITGWKFVWQLVDYHEVAAEGGIKV